MRRMRTLKVERSQRDFSGLNLGTGVSGVAMVIGD